MDKLTLNNEIVKMRHTVRQAKVHVINKLVRESRTLKTKNGSDQQKEKYIRKAERFSEEILHIKKLKDDDISKFALSNEKNPADILSETSVPLEMRTLARLAANKNLSAIVNKFRVQFPTWKLVVPSLLNEIGARNKKNGRKKLKKKKNAQNRVSNKEDKVIKETSNSFEGINSESEGDLETIECVPKFVDKGSDQSDSSSSLRKVKLKINQTGENNMKVNSSGSWTVSQNNKTKVKHLDKPSTISSSPCGVRKKHNTVAEVVRFSDIKDIESKFFDNESESVFDSEINLSENKSVDPFFLTEDGETEYLSSVVKKSQSSENSNDINQESTQGMFSKKRASVEKFGEQTRVAGNFKSFQHKQNNPTQGLNRRERRRLALNPQRNKGNRFEKQSVSKGADSPIHPSWEAKRKLREQQQMVFQGKKIKFDD